MAGDRESQLELRIIDFAKGGKEEKDAIIEVQDQDDAVKEEILSNKDILEDDIVDNKNLLYLSSLYDQKRTYDN